MNTIDDLGDSANHILCKLGFPTHTIEEYLSLIHIFYPIEAHWIWGGGWLAQLGFVDFAGSTAIHMVGGLTALIGAAMVGPRIGKFSKDGKPRAI